VGLWISVDQLNIAQMFIKRHMHANQYGVLSKTMSILLVCAIPIVP